MLMHLVALAMAEPLHQTWMIAELGENSEVR
jgi:hypothetical protein